MDIVILAALWVPKMLTVYFVSNVFHGGPG